MTKEETHTSKTTDFKPSVIDTYKIFETIKENKKNMCYLCTMKYGDFDLTIDHDDEDLFLPDPQDSTSLGSNSNNFGQSVSSTYPKGIQPTNNQSTTGNNVKPADPITINYIWPSKYDDIVFSPSKDTSIGSSAKWKEEGKCEVCGDDGEWRMLQLTCRNGHGRICG